MITISSILLAIKWVAAVGAGALSGIVGVLQYQLNRRSRDEERKAKADADRRASQDSYLEQIKINVEMQHNMLEDYRKQVEELKTELRAALDLVAQERDGRIKAEEALLSQQLLVATIDKQNEELTEKDRIIADLRQTNKDAAGVVLRSANVHENGYVAEVIGEQAKQQAIHDIEKGKVPE